MDAKDDLKLGEVVTNTWKKLDSTDQVTITQEITRHTNTSVQVSQSGKLQYLWLVLPVIFMVVWLIASKVTHLEKREQTVELPQLTQQNSVIKNSAVISVE